MIQAERTHSRSPHLVAIIIGAVLALIGLALGAGGAWLAVLGGSIMSWPASPS